MATNGDKRRRTVVTNGDKRRTTTVTMNGDECDEWRRTTNYDELWRRTTNCDSDAERRPWNGRRPKAQDARKPSADAGKAITTSTARIMPQVWLRVSREKTMPSRKTNPLFPEALVLTHLHTCPPFIPTPIPHFQIPTGAISDFLLC